MTSWFGDVIVILKIASVERERGERKMSEMQVREACMQMEDMDGMQLNGRDSLGILQRALEGKRGKLLENEGKDRYVEFVNRKSERKEKKVRDERRLDIVCVTLAVLSFAAMPTLFFLL